MAAARNSRPSIKPTDVPVIVNIPGLKKPHSGPSLVIKDGIMKEVVKLEEDAKTSWETKYGFLKNSFEVFEAEVEARGISHNVARYKTRRSKTSAMDDGDGSSRVSSQLPKTASGMVGWLAREAPQINVAGPLYISPKQTVYPPDSLEIFLKKQKHIILG